jgi:hypothetical protein
MFVFDLPFPNHVHDFDSRDRFPGCFERLESQHWFYDFLYESMILFNNMNWSFAPQPSFN